MVPSQVGLGVRSNRGEVRGHWRWGWLLSSRSPPSGGHQRPWRPASPPVPELVARDAEIVEEPDQGLWPEGVARVTVGQAQLAVSIERLELRRSVTAKIGPEVPEQIVELAVLEFGKRRGPRGQSVTSSSCRDASLRSSSSASG